jgi:hypothetical protein
MLRGRRKDAVCVRACVGKQYGLRCAHTTRPHADQYWPGHYHHHASSLRDIITAHTRIPSHFSISSLHRPPPKPRPCLYTLWKRSRIAPFWGNVFSPTNGLPFLSFFSPLPFCPFPPPSIHLPCSRRCGDNPWRRPELELAARRCTARHAGRGCSNLYPLTGLGYLIDLPSMRLTDYHEPPRPRAVRTVALIPILPEA